MCGIAGIIGLKTEKRQIVLNKMLERQHHRGPDFTGTLHGDGYSFGHNRLSIIDLTIASNQPMLSECGNFIIVFNGEIYNYKELKLELNYPFKTKGDSEVLLASFIKWGESCLEKLNGMFSFVIYNIKEKTLFAARDRFGVKPFYYTIHENTFYFASEIKALLSINNHLKSWNNKVWSNYMVFGQYASGQETFYESVCQLPAGCKFWYVNNKLKVDSYYNFKDRVLKYNWEKYSINEIKEQIKDTLRKSINYRLIADVKRGFNMSGGMDSTLLFELIRKELNPKLTRAFTFYSNDKIYDELKWVKKILNESDFKLEKCLITVDEIPKFAKKIQFNQDEPYSGIATLAYAKTFQKASEKGFKVILDGSGMDEIAGGYDYYSNNSNNIIQGISCSPFKTNVLNEDFLNLAQKDEMEIKFISNLQNLQYRDLFKTKLPRDLRMTDRISMAYSIEMREPFLDHNLVEMGFSLPDNYKIREGKTKWIMREILKEFIDKSIAEAPKRPIQTPQREWLSNDLKIWVIETIKIALKKSDWLIKNEVEKELDIFFKKDNSNSFYIWQWLSIGLMLEK
jgi:asparagine synthase (glutamine-hydrolysing)